MSEREIPRFAALWFLIVIVITPVALAVLLLKAALNDIWIVWWKHCHESWERFKEPDDA